MLLFLLYSLYIELLNEFCKMDVKSLYQNPSIPGSFAGKSRFIEGLKTRNLRTRGVRKALRGVDSYTLHKPVRKPPKFRRVYTKRIGYLFQIDLCDMQAMKDQNDGFSWLITIIDTFSKKAWVLKTKRKDGLSITKVMRNFLQANTPEKIEFDQVIIIFQLVNQLTNQPTVLIDRLY